MSSTHKKRTKTAKKVNKKSAKTKKSLLEQQLEMINLNAAGIDVASEEMWVCVPPDRVKEQENNVRKFGAFTCDLHTIADWLTECGVTTVAMESTGIYWIPLYQVLETRGFAVCLVNARQMKNVSGRPKTDRLDCRWIQRLHSYGLLMPSFRPPGRNLSIPLSAPASRSSDSQSRPPHAAYAKSPAPDESPAR